MKRFSLLFGLILWVTTLSARIVFRVDKLDVCGYNMIRIVNNTSQENFYCRVVILDDKEQVVDVYGTFLLKEKRDVDSQKANTAIKEGTLLGIELPKDFPVECSASILYKTYPFYNAIIIELTDTSIEFE